MPKGQKSIGGFNGAQGNYYSGGMVTTPAQYLLNSTSEWPPIVKNGLVVMFDGNDYESYPGSGTVAYDKMSDRTASLTGVTYSKPFFMFDGTSSSASFSVSGIDFSTAQTIVLVLKPTEADANRRNPYNHEFAGHGTITHEPSGIFNYFHGTSGGNTNVYQGTSSTMTVGQNETAMVTLTRGRDYVRWYKNGALDVSVANTCKITFSATTTANFGNGYAGYYQGGIALLMLYTRELTASEVLQNYTAVRGKYGI